MLILADEAVADAGGEGSVEALDCDWYIYADASGWALDFSVAHSADAEANTDDQTELPPGIDPESVHMADIEFGA